MSNQELQEAALKKVEEYRKFGIGLGIPLDNMFDAVEKPLSECALYAVWRPNPYHPDAKYYASFGSDNQAAKKWESDLQTKGYDTFMRSYDVYGRPGIKLNEEFLRCSDPYQLQVILEEGLHVWVAKYFACGEDIPLVLDEALANFMSFHLMLDFFKNNDKNGIFSGSQYIAYKTIWFDSINRMYFAVREKGLDQARTEIDEFLDLGTKFKKSFRMPKLKDGDTKVLGRDYVNIAIVSFYFEYTGLFFKVWQYFFDNKLPLEEFLANPYPHRKNLMDLVKSVA